LLNKQSSTRSILTIDSAQFDHSRDRLDQSLHRLSVSGLSSTTDRNSMADLRERGLKAMQNSSNEEQMSRVTRRPSLKPRRVSSKRLPASQSSDISYKRRQSLIRQGSGRVSSQAHGGFVSQSSNDNLTAFRLRGTQLRIRDSTHSLSGHSNNSLLGLNSSNNVSGFRPYTRSLGTKNATWDNPGTGAKRNLNQIRRSILTSNSAGQNPSSKTNQSDTVKKTSSMSNRSPTITERDQYPLRKTSPCTSTSSVEVKKISALDNRRSSEKDQSPPRKTSPGTSTSSPTNSFQYLEYWTNQIALAERRGRSRDQGNDTIPSFSSSELHFDVGNILHKLCDESKTCASSKKSGGPNRESTESQISHSNYTVSEKFAPQDETIISEADDKDSVTSTSSDSNSDDSTEYDMCILPENKDGDDFTSLVSMGELYDFSSADASRENQISQAVDIQSADNSDTSGLVQPLLSEQKTVRITNTDQKGAKKIGSKSITSKDEQKRKRTGRAKRGVKTWFKSPKRRELSDTDPASKPSTASKHSSRSSLMLTRPLVLTKDNIREEFEAIDKNGDEKIQKEELREYVSSGKLGTACMNKPGFEALWSCMDTNSSGEVDFFEFCSFMEQK